MTADPDDPQVAPLQRAMRLDDRLDDLRRVRIWSQLDRLLDTEDARISAPRRGIVASGSRRWLAVAIAAAALMVALGVALWILVARGDDGLLRTVAPPAAQVIEVPAGASARTQLGAASITLLGPARLAVARAHHDVDVTLELGRLAGDYDHRRGGRMRIRTPHALIDIVGTIFSIEVSDRTCVSVTEGTVRVAVTGLPPRELHADDSWCTGTGTETVTGIGTATATGTGTSTGTGAATGTGTATGTARKTAGGKAAAAKVANGSGVAGSTARVAEATEGGDAARGARGGTAPEAKPPADEELYATAELAMRYGDTALADALLARLVVDHPQSGLIDEALFERARLAYQRGAWTAARTSLDQLLEGGATPLREPARFLACRIAVRTKDRDAGPCLDELRRTTTDPRLALEALELRLDVAHRVGGCPALPALVAELAAAAPTRPSLAAWRRRCPGTRP